MSLHNTLTALRDECGPADSERRQRLDKAINDLANGGVASLIGLPARNTNTNANANAA